MDAQATGNAADARPSDVHAAGDGEESRQAVEAAATETEAHLPAPKAAGGDAPREPAGPSTGARARQATQSAEDGEELAEDEERRQAVEAVATAIFAQQARLPAPTAIGRDTPREQAGPSSGASAEKADHSEEEGKEKAANERSGQALPQETRGVAPEAVAMACLSMARWTTVGPGDTVTQIQTGRWAVVESVARGAGGHEDVSVRFRRGDRCTEAAHRFMAGSAPADPEAWEGPGESRIPRCISPTCSFQAHPDSSRFFGYCCGCCRLRHTGEKQCNQKHGPLCLGIPFEGASSADEEDSPWVGLD